jgi:hypothetical protein
MTELLEPRFEASDQAVLDTLWDLLRARGWPAHATVPTLLQDWRKLAVSVDGYQLNIDYYTSDLMTRDGLEIVLSACQDPFRAKLRRYVEDADAAFLARTEEDSGSRLGRYFRVDESSGWWWKRRPAGGPLAAFLAG